jgi:hypothetical protein
MLLGLAKVFAARLRSRHKTYIACHPIINTVSPSGKIAIITLMRATDDSTPAETLTQELRKAIASLPLFETWRVEAVSILDDPTLRTSAQATIKTS